MRKLRLGRTNLEVSGSGFGALPIQRVSLEEADRILKKAYYGGINFFDTARMYTDSEEKIGCALSGVRENIIIATKSHAKDKKTLREHLETSLRDLKTDYVDVYQLHNIKELPDENDKEGLYSGLIEARDSGKARYIGITTHRLDVALQAARSGLFDTVQFPISSISEERELEIIRVCRELDVGLIAMKALSGGLITNAASAFAFFRQFDSVVPIWGIQREEELEEFLEMEKNPPELDETLREVIRRDREELAGNFCRGCGYCLPCPIDIDIPIAARMSLLLRRAPHEPFLERDWLEKMELIAQCKNCGQCKERCPYGLNTPGILKEMLDDYREFYRKHRS
ncbi:MAG: aldo/keto reductase [Bacillota bacterium]|nr:aldo/keto reductase [Bacillota bacterium]